MVSAVVKPTQMKKQSQPRSLTSLPDEIIENCLARISRWNYTFLSLVSKKFHSILSSKELYMTRSQIGSHETYICLRVPGPASSRWFSLWPKPNSNGNLLVPIPTSYYPTVPHASTVAVGSEIYVIGGSFVRSSSVLILDCRTHTWREGPNMNSARSFASANVLDEKIYVMGGCEFANNWMEVFDIKTQSWTSFPSPCDDLNELRKYEIIHVFQGKLHVVLGTKDYTYELTEGRWNVVRELEKVEDIIYCWCVVENVIYCCTEAGYCMRYDYKGGKWEVIKSLEELREKGLSNGNVLDIVNRGGKLLVFWEPKLESDGRSSWKNRIWYAEVSLETRRTSCNGSEIWGKIESLDVLTVPGMSYSDLKVCLVVSV